MMPMQFFQAKFLISSHCTLRAAASQLVGEWQPLSCACQSAYCLTDNSMTYITCVRQRRADWNVADGGDGGDGGGDVPVLIAMCE